MPAIPYRSARRATRRLRPHRRAVAAEPRRACRVWLAPRGIAAAPRLGRKIAWARLGGVLAVGGLSFGLWWAILRAVSAAVGLM